MELQKRKLLSLVGVSILLAAVMGGCGGAPPEANQGHDEKLASLEPVALSSGEKLQVVATTNILGDVIAQIGGEQIALTTLMEAGIDPHSYVPTPADTAAIHDADVFFANGAGLEADLEEMFRGAGGTAIQIHVSDDLAHRLTGDLFEKAGQEHTHDDENLDPHAWFDVQNVIQWVETIKQTLSALDPANAATYRANAAAYTAELEELDAWVAEQVATIPEANRRLVTNHPAFGYLANRYGLEQVGAVYPISPSAEPSARDIAALEDAIRQHSVPAVFTESTVNPNLAQQVAQDTGVALVALYSGSLGEPGSGVESYVALIRYDVKAIVDALK
jgi:ABC-type Zn uptake system ZnuABC Zn-binding protein ZnuA